MAITATEGGTRELVPAGLHLAICTEMIELGTSEDTFGNETKTRKKVWIGFEACQEVRQNQEGEDYCLSIGSTYTLSLGTEAKLRKVLESWRSKPFTSDELKGFDIKNVLGKPCMITVVHKQKQGGGDKAEISAISPIMKGMAIPAQTNKTRLIEFDAFDHDMFNSLPDFLTKEIRRSKEYEVLTQPKMNSQPGTAFGSVEDEDDTLPF